MNQEAGNEKIRIVSPSRREIDLTVPPETVREEMESILSQYASKAKLAGFRKGKAPKDLVQKMFLPEIRKDAMESLVPRALETELKETGIRMVSVPIIEDAGYGEDETLKAKVSFEVLPEFDLPEYKKIRLTRGTTDVEDKDVDRTLEELRERSIEYVPADGRSVVDGDYVVVEIQGRDLKTKRLMPSEKIVVLAGHEENEKALNEILPGMKVGEEKNFETSYPADHPNKKLAGKTLGYRIKIQSVKEKKIPPLNDDLAKTIGPYQTLEELRGKIRESLVASKIQAEKNRLASELIKKIADEVTIELPPSLVEDEARSVLSRILRNYPQTGLKREQAEMLAGESRKQAEQNIKNNLILIKISEKEGITVLEPEFQDELKALAEAHRIPLEKVSEMVDKEGRRGDLEESVLIRKTIDFLVAQAIIE